MKKLLNHWVATWRPRTRPGLGLAEANDEWLRRLREAGL